jgi:hypothetical protein
MVLAVSFVLSAATGLCCHRRRRDAKKTPDIIANLTPASGRPDHTTSPSAIASFVHAQMRVTTLPRPPHPDPTFVTIAKRPSCGTGRTLRATDLPRKKSEIFSAKGWTGRNSLNLKENFLFYRHSRIAGRVA